MCVVTRGHTHITLMVRGLLQHGLLNTNLYQREVKPPDVLGISTDWSYNVLAHLYTYDFAHPLCRDALCTKLEMNLQKAGASKLENFPKVIYM